MSALPCKTLIFHLTVVPCPPPDPVDLALLTNPPPLPPDPFPEGGA